jgi:phenylpropionate dioxygenase-like ring-hydroxylating dioxygenase large terminal subunit
MKHAGKLREVPSTPDKQHLPKRSLVASYTVEEKGGFVWLFFGSRYLNVY